MTHHHVRGHQNEKGIILNNDDYLNMIAYYIARNNTTKLVQINPIYNLFLYKQQIHHVRYKKSHEDKLPPTRSCEQT